MQFHEVRFPTNLSFGSMGGPERRTEIVTLANGFEERNTPWSQSRRRYDAGLGMRSLDDIEQLFGFFEARQGQMYGFRWKDWADYKSCPPSRTPAIDDQNLGEGDGVRVLFELTKLYESGSQSYARTITKPVSGTVKVGLDGVAVTEGTDFEIDTTSGSITFSAPPTVGAKISAGFEFDVPVRFDTDRIQTSIASFQAGDIPSVPVVELRV